MTKKKMVTILNSMMMCQDHYLGTGELDCRGVKLVDVTRYPGVLTDLISEGRFGQALGQALRALIFVRYETNKPCPDDEVKIVRFGRAGWRC